MILFHPLDRISPFEVAIKAIKAARERLPVMAMLACIFAVSFAQSAVVSGGEHIISGPRIMRVIAPSGTEAGRDAVIALSFNRPMDLRSLADSAIFEPRASFSVSGEAEVLIVPVNLLSPGTRYTFRLEAESARDTCGAVLSQGLEIVFTTRSDAMEIELPSFSYSGPVIEGSDPQGVASAIGFGVGHYPGTGRPGRGNLVLMAHASGLVDFPFNRLFDLQEGAEIWISYGGRRYMYRWEQSLVVRHSDMWIIDPLPRAVITFFVCCAENGRPSPTFNPPYRYVVRAAIGGALP